LKKKRQEERERLANERAEKERQRLEAQKYVLLLLDINLNFK
jgi:hypothetical protein